MQLEREQKTQIKRIKLRVNLMSGLVVALYTCFMIVSYVQGWGLIYLSMDFTLYTASSIIFIQALIAIRRTMRSYDIAFSNEKFLRIHAINFLVYITVSWITFGLSIAYSNQMGK